MKIAIKKAHHINIPHQVLYGIKELLIENAYKNIVTVLETTDTKKNDKKSIDINPATKQSKSSGKNGNKNITRNINELVPLNDFSALSNLFSPIIHLTILYPKYLPIKKATSEPDKMPITLYILAKKGPNSNTPAPTEIEDGIGSTTTCKNCITT